MVRKLFLVLALISLAGLSTWAQGLSDKIEVSAGYTYMRFGATPAVNLNGWALGGQYKLSGWLGVVADVNGEYGRVGGASSHVYTYLVGPQVSWPRRISPFAHVLLGGAHFSGGNFTSRSFAYGIGVGIDTKISTKLSWRIIELDAIPTHLGSNDQHNTRLLTGIVYRF
jgi:hypothetical protein